MSEGDKVWKFEYISNHIEAIEFLQSINLLNMSSRIESINIVEVYEENGQELKALRSKKPSITIREHWNRKEFVIVNMGELSYTVCAKDLEKAIQNAQNAHSGF